MTAASLVSRGAKPFTMEPVTKWTPKQVVDWTRGEQASGDPGVLQPWDWRELGKGAPSPFGGRDAVRTLRGDKANFCRVRPYLLCLL